MSFCYFSANKTHNNIILFHALMAEDSSPSTRYATLLEQIVHLNTDLQKAVSLNQAIQLEGDEAREQSAKVRMQAPLSSFNRVMLTAKLKAE